MMSARGCAVVCALLCAVAWMGEAQATEFSELGLGLGFEHDSAVELDGALRLRAEALNNLDLDHGLTPSGQPLYPLPLDPLEQTLHHADMRLRADFSLYAPYGSVSVKGRIDALDNLTLGSTPDGTPLTTTTQRSPSQNALNIKRLWGEALTPFGVIAAGRMGNTWGLGMLTNGGDCADCDSGDAADRVAFVTSQLNHFVAVAYDVGWVGPTTPRKVETRAVDIERRDNLRTFTVAILRQRDQRALDRRAGAGKVTFDYGAVFSSRRQDKDIPAAYIPTDEPVVLSSAQVVDRGFRAYAGDVWLRLVGPSFRMEAEVAVLQATIDEASVVPGVRYGYPLRSLQYGGAIQTDFGPREGRLSAGLDLGLASGDGAPGFGARPSATPGQPGDLEGAQVNPPYDTSANNFRFHPDYRVDQILFREILGTVTDAVYIRPHVRWDMWSATPGKITFRMAAVASSALYATSTPGGDNPLGVELDPSIDYISRDLFGLGLDYAVLFPLAGLDNAREGIPARPAQLLRLRIRYGF